MKKSISVFLSLMLLVMMICAVPAASSAEIMMVEVTQNASIRTQPNFNAEKIVLATVGKQYLLLATEGSWYKIQMSNDRIGYLPANSTKLVAFPGIPTGSAKEAFASMLATLRNPGVLEKNLPETFPGKTAIGIYYDMDGAPLELSPDVIAENGWYRDVPEEFAAAEMKDADWALLIYPTFGNEEGERVQVNVFAADIRNKVFYAPYLKGTHPTILSGEDNSYDLEEMLSVVYYDIYYPKWERINRLATNENYQDGLRYMNEGRYYSAYQSFMACGLEEGDEKAEQCVRPWPKTGEIWHNSSVRGNVVTLTIAVNQDSDRALLAKIYKGDTHVSSLFIGGTGQATVNLPAGTYVIKDGSGSEWIGPTESFGPYGSYETMTFDDNGNEEVALKANYSYKITVNVSDLDPNAQGVGSHYENWDGFND